jgi:hypothetical protein
VFFAGGARLLGRGLWKGGDAGLIDGIIVNGSATPGRLVCDPGRCSRPVTFTTTLLR